MLFKIDQIWYLICIYISSHTFMVACCYKNNMFINKHETLHSSSTKAVITEVEESRHASVIKMQCWKIFLRNATPLHLRRYTVQSRLAITRLTITRIGYNAVGRGPRISAARGEMGATANNNAVINCHLFLWSPHVCLVQVYLETIYWY